MGSGHPAPPTLIAVHRQTLPGNVTPAPRDRSGTVFIAGNVVRPLKPIQQTRLPYSSGAENPGYRAPNAPANSYSGRSGTPTGSAPRPIAVPARPGNTYTPPPATRPYTPPPAYAHPAPPPVVHSAPPPVMHTAPPPQVSHPAPPAGGGGGAHPSGGSPHR